MTQLSAESLTKLSSTCRLFRNEFQGQAGANELTKRVAWGDEAGAKEILGCRPELLLATFGVASDVFSREGMDIKRGMTPFQVALCAGDVEMCKMMKPYFDDLENGQ